MTGVTHLISVDGTVLTYRAEWESLSLDDARTTISATSYTVLRPNSRAPGNRPVIFLCNGGPGASSSPLHFSAFGPKVLTAPGFDGTLERRLVDNPSTLLDRADLVFIDPVGTGFNRTSRTHADAPYLSVDGDASAMERFIRRWLLVHRRQASPITIIGESYGAFRVATMCRDIADLPIERLVLISPLLDASAGSTAVGNDLKSIFELPTMALAAWHHGRAASLETEPIAVWERARDFAQGEYASALQHGTDISEARAQRIAGRVAAFVGWSDEEVLAANLRIDSEHFLQSMLADDGLLVGRLDTRVTGPTPPPAVEGRSPAADDPALGIGRSNVIVSPTIAAHLREAAGAEVGDLEYRSLNLNVNFRFDWRSSVQEMDFYRNPTRHLAELLEQRCATELLVIGGYYDLSTPWLAARYALAHAGIPADRLRLLPLVGGHSISPDALPSVAETVRSFLP